MQIVIVTGLSGRGQEHRAARARGHRVLLRRQHPGAAGRRRWSIISRTRATATSSRSRSTRGSAATSARGGARSATLRGAGHRLEVMFLDASDEVLLRRFSETRRRHPLSGDDLSEGVRRDRELMGDLRDGATIVDTIEPQHAPAEGDHPGVATAGPGRLAVTLVSFGFKHGLPLEFNLVFDVRFLPNPYFEPQADAPRRARPGGRAVSCSATTASSWCAQVERLLRFALPQFQRRASCT